MTEPATAVATLVLLGLWHRHNRRHPGWRVSADGRFYVLSGYATLTVAVYWLATAPTNTAWEWALGNAWSIAAMACFVYGFNALNKVPRPQQSVSQAIESLSLSTDRIA